MRGRLSSRALGWFVGVAGALSLVSGGALGARLGEAASRPRIEEIRVADPAGLAPTAGLEARSPAGFTGFGGPPALEGEVLRKGVASEVRPGALTLVDGGARSTIEFTQPVRLFRVAAAAAPLAPGDNVVVRYEDGRATGVLRVRQASR